MLPMQERFTPLNNSSQLYAWMDQDAVVEKSPNLVARSDAPSSRAGLKGRLLKKRGPR